MGLRDLRKDPDSVVLKLNLVEEKDIFDVEVSGSFDKVIHSLLFVCVRVMRKYSMEKANEKSVKDLCTKFGESLYRLVKVDGSEEK